MLSIAAALHHAQQALNLTATHPPDLLITCHGREFHTRRMILTPHSPWFQSELFLVGALYSVIAIAPTNHISQTNAIDLNDRPEVVERVLLYMHIWALGWYQTTIDLSFDYLMQKVVHATGISEQSAIGGFDHIDDDATAVELVGAMTDEVTTPLDDAFAELEMYSFANKYDVAPLKAMAHARFTEWVKRHYTSKDLPELVREI